MNRRIGVQQHYFQLHVGRRPNPAAHFRLHRQQLLRGTTVQGREKSPQRGLRRQSRDLENPRQHWILGDKTQLAQAAESDIDTQYHRRMNW